MHTFEITVQRKSGDIWPVVVEQSTSGVFLPVRDEGTLRLDLTELVSQTTPKEYGLVLGRAVFRDEIRDAFVQALTRSEDYLRVLLFVEADDLKTLRWERLCAPLDRAWDFLALTQRAPFCLYLPSLTDRRFPPFGRRDLRALVLVASPDGLERYRLQPFDVMTAISSVRAALGEIPCDVLARMEGAAGPPTLDALCERITAESYTLFHVVCHGQFMRETGETVLYWDTADHGVDPVAGTRLLERLGRLQGARGLPHCAFLGTCESARAEAEGALGGLAQRLVRELGMPAVVAMTETVSVTTAQALGAAFYGRLREHGEVDRALVEACAGLAERFDITVPALYSRLGGRPLFSDTPDRPLTHAEIGFGLDRLDTLLAARAPVLQEIFQIQAVHLRSALGADVTEISVEARQEHEQALAEVNKLCGEALDLSFAALALGQEPPAYDGRCPFRGLYPFRQEDREFFFGREALIEHLRQKLAAYPCLPVLGPSGSGKSSLVLAGLIPALQAQEPDLQMAYLTPGAAPLTQLEASLASVPDGRAVLVVDQFEELFTLCTDQEARRAFLGRLLALAEKRRVVITMRADFWGECAPYHDLKDIMQARQELIAPMDVTELRRAMELQASKVGLRFEADLSHTILEDVQGEPGAMPLLQHALLELWKRRHGRWLRAEEYRAIGGVQQAMARTADDLYEQLAHGEQERVRDIFMRLTRLDDDTVPGEARRDTRRRVGLQELVPAASDPTLIRALVHRLADSRLVVTSRNEAAGREEVEVAHEALIRYWPRLRRWLDEDRASLRLRDTIRQAALEWEAGGREDNLLVHRGGRLRDAEALARHPRFTLNELEQAYVDACVALRETQRAQEEAQRQRELEAARQLAAEAEARRQAEEQARQEAEQRVEEQVRSTRSLRKWRRVLAVVALLAAVIAVLAVLQQHKAEQQARIATSRQLAVQARSQLDNSRLDLALLLSLEAHNTANTDEARGILAASLEHSPHLATLMPGHPSRISSIAFSPDGRTLASGSQEGTILLWDAATGQRRGGPLTSQSVQSTLLDLRLTFSPDGQTLGAVVPYRIFLWDLAQPEPPRTPNIPCQVMGSLAFKKEGRTFIASCPSQGIILGSGATEEWRQLPLKGESGTITSVFSADGKTLATVVYDGILVWDVESGEQLKKIDIRDAYDQPLALSPNGQMLALGNKDGTIVLWDIARQEQLGEPLTGHKDRGPVRSIAFGPEGQTLASDGSDNTIMLWDLTSRKPLGQPLTGHRGAVSSLVFSPNGRILASGDDTGLLMQWHVTRGQDLGQPLASHSGERSAVALSLDGQTLAIGSTHGLVTLLDVTRGQVLEQPLTGYKGELLGVALNSDNKVLAVGREDNAVVMRDVVSRQLFCPPITGDAGSRLEAIRSLDGQTLAVLDGDNTIKLWDVHTCMARELPLPQDGTVAFSPDGKILKVVTRDGAVFGWDVPTLAPLGEQFRAEAGGRLSVSSDAKVLAFIDREKGTVWDFSTGKRLAELELGKAWDDFGGPNRVREWAPVVSSVALHPDGKTLALGGKNGLLFLLDITAGKQLRHPLFEHGGMDIGSYKTVLHVAFSPDGKILASGTGDGTILLWDVPGQESLQQIKGHGDPVLGLTFSHDGKTLVWHTRDIIGLWDVATRQPLAQRTNLHLAKVSSVAFSPDSKILASGSADKTIVLWDLASGQPRRAPLTGHSDTVASLAFSPDSKILASGSSDKTIIFWEVASGQPRRAPLTGHSDAVVSLAFSPDGKTLASGSADKDKTIVLWDVTSGQPQRTPLTGHSDTVTSLAFSPDGKTMASGSADGCILWDVTTHTQRGQFSHACAKVVTDVIFGPDGKTLAAGGEGGVVILGDITTGQLLRQPLIGQSTHVLRVAFPDGKTLLTVGEEDGRIMRWDISVETWQQRACRIANRNLTGDERKTLISLDTPYRRSCPDLPSGEGAPPDTTTAPR